MAECSLVALVNISSGCCHTDEALNWRNPSSVGVVSHEELLESANCHIAGRSLLRGLRNECSHVKYIYFFTNICILCLFF